MAGARMMSASEELMSVMVIMLQGFLGVAAHDLIRWNLARQGYREIGIAGVRICKRPNVIFSVIGPGRSMRRALPQRSQSLRQSGLAKQILKSTRLLACSRIRGIRSCSL